MFIYTFITDVHMKTRYLIFKLSLLMAFLNFVVRGIVNYEIKILMLPVMSYPFDNCQFQHILYSH